MAYAPPVRGVDENIRACASQVNRGQDISDFVYHCHILNHEDQAMMAIIRVLPCPAAKETPKAKDMPAKITRREDGIVNVASVR
ncbi:MAG: multicopper oxidase domain-containing protein [Candidatus Binatus sp.]